MMDEREYLLGRVKFLLRVRKLYLKYGERILTDYRYRTNHLAKERRRRQLAKRGLTLAQYSNRTYFTKRQILKKRTHGWCVICNQRTPRELLTIDHKISIKDGGPNTKDNLQLICLPCHLKKDFPSDRNKV